MPVVFCSASATESGVAGTTGSFHDVCDSGAFLGASIAGGVSALICVDRALGGTMGCISTSCIVTDERSGLRLVHRLGYSAMYWLLLVVCVLDLREVFLQRKGTNLFTEHPFL